MDDQTVRLALERHCDIPEAKVRFFDTGHFTLETHYAKSRKSSAIFLDERAGK